MADGKTTGAEEASRFSGEQHGWAPDVDDKTGEAKEGANKAFDASNAGEPGPGAAPSAAESQGVEPTDTTAASPKGVGVSTTRRGEDMIEHEGKEEGRHDAGTQGPSQRPVGTSTPEASTGVDPQDSGEESPSVQTGDQAG